MLYHIRRHMVCICQDLVVPKFAVVVAYLFVLF
jgi:hypothetical protein